ncbi:exopolysaccharide biosynthesis operon protein EpsL [Methylophilus rhizosphaerae]|uniref:Exopolysaccharide biosynthesis operon protein EpsL n=2 Tax=Methylophilus rhizosphaerae TaxID=492660 RepID=A0A1G8Z3Q9_9PROT|nr:exopolysaccharide biosynthesis operon protein EpsL [Methylophilus rhizosphaerae]
MPLKHNYQKLRFLAHQFLWGCCLLDMVSHQALADQADTLNFSASTTKLFDDNLFRRPDGEVSDQVTVNRLGINVDKAYSLQKFHANLNVTDNKYNKSDFLDFTAKQYSLGWDWAVTPNLTGTLETSRDERLNDFRFVTAPVKNVVTIKTHNFEADFSPHKIFHFLAGVTVIETENDNAFNFDQQEEISNRTRRLNLGGRYDFASSYLKAMYHKGHSEQANNIADPSRFARWIDKESNSDSYELVYETTSDKRLNYKAHLGYVNKETPVFTMRNYSGWVGDVSATYALTSKISLNGYAGRTLRSFIREDSSYAEIDSFKLGLRYEFSPKLAFMANTSYLTRNYLGRGPAGNGHRDDHEASALAGVYWSPRNFVNASLSVSKSRRNSTDNFFDYDDTSAFMTVGLLF